MEWYLDKKKSRRYGAIETAINGDFETLSVDQDLKGSAIEISIYTKLKCRRLKYEMPLCLDCYLLIEWGNWSAMIMSPSKKTLAVEQGVISNRGIRSCGVSLNTP